MRAIFAFAMLIAFGCATIGAAQETIPPDVLQKLKRASVFVKVTLGPLEYSGSGFVIRVEGDAVYLVTNAHVVAKPDLNVDGLPPGNRGREALEFQRLQAAIRDLQPEVNAVFNSGTNEEQVVVAKTVALDSARDLAILKVDKVRTPPKPIPFDINFRPSETTTVFIFGFPFGEALSKTKGNPSITVGRGAVSSVRLDDRGEDTVVQIDGALNPGNSGGPVVDVKGRLVGVAVATIRGSGIGFAIPPSTLDKILSGGVENVEFTPRITKDQVEIDIKLTLVDPFHKIKGAFANCAFAKDASLALDASKPLEGTRVEFKTVEGKLVGKWSPPKPTAQKLTVLFQATVVDENGVERRLPATKHSLKMNLGNTSQARASARRRGLFSLMRPLLEEIVRDSIVEQLNRQDKPTVQQAMRELSQYDPTTDETRIASAIEKHLSHTDESIRSQAAKLIGIWGTKENGAAVVKLLEDGVAEIRQAAMESLANVGFADAAEAIVKRLVVASDRHVAKQTLIRLGGAAEDPVVKCLGSAELPIRIIACEILGEIGSKDVAIPALKEIVDRESGLLLSRAKEAIDRINVRITMPQTLAIRLAGPDNRRVHVGLPIQQGNMVLSEGSIILRDTGPAIGLGLIQTGNETMEFSYIMLARLPRTNIGKATFSARKKNLKNRLRVSHDVFLGDDELTLEHLFAPDKLPFVDEEFVIHEQSFAPTGGRLFLADISGAQPVIVQKDVALPVAGSFVAINDEVLLDLADLAINDLIQANDEVREFMNDGKLIGGLKPEQSK